MVVFDANGTLFELTLVEQALGSAVAAEAFFERLLHGAATLTLADGWTPFDELAASTLRTTCAKLGLDVDQQRVLAALQELPPAPGAREAVAAAGPCAILTNSGGDTTRRLVASAGLDVETILSVEEVRAYKPAPAPYLMARERLGADCVLVAAHAWDVAGARAAGLRAVWVDRGEREWALAGVDPGERAPTLEDAVARTVG